MKTSINALLTFCCVVFLMACEKSPAPMDIKQSNEKPSEEKLLHIYNWSDYIDPDVIKAFTDETGIKVVYDSFDSSETLETKLLVGKTGYDIVVPGAPFLGRQIQAGVFMTLDKSKLDNWQHLDPEILKILALYDHDNAHAIPYLWGTTGLGFNVKRVRAIVGDDVELNSFDWIFKPENISKLAKCGVAFVDAPGEVEGAALHYLGLTPGSLNEQDYNAAEKLLSSVRPYIRYFNSSQYVSDLANGDICVAFGWNGDILQAARRAEEANNGEVIEYYLPQQGTEVWIDTLAIPQDATHPNNAHVFINFLMRPEMIAKISNFVAYPNANFSSYKLIDSALMANPNIFPNAAMREKLYAVPVLPENIDRVITRSWTKVKTGQ